ncbi:hypothetical protein AB2M62_07035 [Sphingomonas sp. MMS12-HWE2-04]|uniref:hypothetical protein n=1 Tax=Sphingomonas sp. MMS12-HWE2-04 TaxID=3234199 RepID=UPI00384E8BD1
MTLALAAWAYLLWSGMDGLLAIEARHVSGYPAWGQLVLYAGLPAMALTLLIVSSIVARRTRWFYDLYPFVVGLLGFALFPTLLVWGGGV